MHSCLLRCQPLPTSCLASATRLEVDVTFYNTISVKDMRRKVAVARKELWNAQKAAEDEREKWIEKLAQDRTRAAGDKDWERK
jgi:hypothetical protein